MNLILVSTVYKSGKRKGQTRKVFKKVMEASDKAPTIDFETGHGSMRMVDENGNLYRLEMTPKDLSAFFGAIPMGLMPNDDSRIPLGKAIIKIIEILQAKGETIKKKPFESPLVDGLEKTMGMQLPGIRSFLESHSPKSKKP
jgi:hypothetical protein